MKTKTSIHEELKVLEEANYQSLDEKRITITAWLVNRVAELQEQIDKIQAEQDRFKKIEIWKARNGSISASANYDFRTKGELSDFTKEMIKKNEDYFDELMERPEQDQEKLEDRECRFGLKNCSNPRCKHIETEV